MSENTVQLQSAAHGEQSMPEGESLSMGFQPPAFQLQASPDQAPVQRDTEEEPETSGPTRVMVIGSPGPAEVPNRPYQFMNAALYQGTDANTIWIVERTGYEFGDVDLGHIESSVGDGRIIWLTPETSLVSILNGLPANSISTMRLYSHGLAGQITLRYGWYDQGHANYGLSMSEIDGLRGTAFTAQPDIEFHACNTGSDTDDGNIAAEFANQTGHDVRAWTGRTSYTEVNDGADDGDTDIQGSRADRGGGRMTLGYDMTEVYSQNVRGRVPILTDFAADPSFESHIDIGARLPETRYFYIPRSGSVTLSFSNVRVTRPDRPATADDELTIILHEAVFGFDQTKGEQIVRPASGESATFSSLDPGRHYFEIIKRSAPVSYYERFEADVSVNVSG